MGILHQGIFGGFSNKTGHTIGRRWRNKDVITALYRRSNKPEKEGEIIQQNRFKMLTHFLSDVALLVEEGFKKFSKKRSALNSAYAFNAPHAYLMEGEETVLNYPELKYSRGPVDTPDCPTLNAPAPDQITFKWMMQDESMYCRSSDLASFLLYEPVGRLEMTIKDGAKRSDREFTCAIGTAHLGKTLHCYMNFTDKDGKLTGDSVYVGLYTP